jgi:hypothetical protein
VDIPVSGLLLLALVSHSIDAIRLALLTKKGGWKISTTQSPNKLGTPDCEHAHAYSVCHYCCVFPLKPVFFFFLLVTTAIMAYFNHQNS